MKLKRNKFIIGTEVEFGGSMLTVEKVRIYELIFITPKGKIIKAFEKLRKPTCKCDFQPGVRWDDLKSVEVEPHGGPGDPIDKKGNCS